MKAHNQSVEQLEYENAQFQLHDAACKLDGARIPCAAADYQSRDPRFYGINGCIHYLNTQIARAHQEKHHLMKAFKRELAWKGKRYSKYRSFKHLISDSKTTSLMLVANRLHTRLLSLTPPYALRKSSVQVHRYLLKRVNEWQQLQRKYATLDFRSAPRLKCLCIDPSS